MGKIGDVRNKLLPIVETAATGLGYGPEVVGFETARKGLDMVNNAKNTVDSLRNQGRAFKANDISPAQIKPKYDYSDVYNLNSLFKGQYFSFLLYNN